MRFKKFILIPVLIFAYIHLVNFLVVLPLPRLFPSPKVKEKELVPGVERIGIGEIAEVHVIRPYFFGLIRLPVYTSSLGDISAMHTGFFYFIIVLTAIFLIMEYRGFKRKIYKEKTKYTRKKMVKANWKKILFSLGIGALFGLVTFILSGDGGVSVGIALLVIYLENRLVKAK